MYTFYEVLLSWTTADPYEPQGLIHGRLVWVASR